MTDLNGKREWRLVCLIGLMLAFVTLAAYWPVRQFDFVNYDDPAYVTDNPHVLAGLSLANAGWAFRALCLGNWHPLTELSHMLDVQLFGLNPGGHHLTSLCFHIANTVLLFLLLRRLTGRVWASAFVAALFALHPLHVESVAWISERKDVLSTFFSLLSLWAYTRYAQKFKVSGSKFKVFYALAFLFFLCALMSKAMAVTLPLVMLLLDFWPLGRFQRSLLWRLVLEKLPFVVLAVVVACVSVLLLSQAGTTKELPGVGLEDRLVRPFVACQFYLVKTFWPADLAVPYLRPPQWPMWEIFSAAAVIGLLSFGAIYQAPRRPYLLVGWFWFLGTLVPVIGLVPVGAHLMADRYTYFPLIGIFIALVWLATESSSGGQLRRIVLAVVTGFVLLASGVATRRQLRYWHDSGTLFAHSLEVTHDNYVAHYCLATFFYREGRLDDAITQYQLSLQIAPDYAEERNDLGTALRREGRVDEAITQYEKTLESIPDSALVHCNLGIALGQKGKIDDAVKQFQEAVRLDPTLALPYISLGKVHISEGKIADGISELKTALRLKPKDIGVQEELADVLIKLGRAGEALPYCEFVVQAGPGDAHAHYNLGSAYLATRNQEQAVVQFKEALRLSPDSAQCMNALAWIYATSPKAEMRNGPEAVRLAEAACKITKRQQAMMLDTLAAAYAEAGRFGEAIKTTGEIRDLAVSSHDPAAADTARRRLELYQAGKAYRDEP